MPLVSASEVRKAMWLSAAVFAAVHLEPSAFVPLCVTGFLAARIYEKHGSLWPCIALHASTNAVAMLGLAMKLTMPSFLPPGN